jgi:hypothetical protein
LSVKEQQEWYQKSLHENFRSVIQNIHSDSVVLVTEVGITQKRHVRAKDSVPNRSEPERFADNDAILSDDMAAY